MATHFRGQKLSKNLPILALKTFFGEINSGFRRKSDIFRFKLIVFEGHRFE